MTTHAERDDAREAVSDDAGVHAGADRPPTAAEAAVADKLAMQIDPKTKEHFTEMAEIGANVRGEGQIEPE